MKDDLRLVFWELTAKCNLKCCHCREFKDKSEFYPDKHTTLGIGGYCRKCSYLVQKVEPSVCERPKKLETIDRNTLKGFIRYFSQRPYIFYTTFHRPYSIEVAKEEFTKRKKLKLDVSNYNFGYAPGCSQRSAYAPHA